MKATVLFALGSLAFATPSLAAEMTSTGPDGARIAARRDRAVETRAAPRAAPAWETYRAKPRERATLDRPFSKGPPSWK